MNMDCLLNAGSFLLSLKAKSLELSMVMLELRGFFSARLCILTTLGLLLREGGRGKGWFYLLVSLVY